MASWLFAPSAFDLLLDKATSPLIPIGTHDLATNLDLADQIRAKQVQPLVAALAIKRKLTDRNPNVQLLALRLLDGCIKNGGDHFLAEIGAREPVDALASLCRSTANHDVRKLALDLVQQWALTFAAKDELAYLVETYDGLKTTGMPFPPPPAVSLSLSASAFTSTSTLPTWSDATVCQRCRTPFSFTNRKHHCRNCGRVFDQACSAGIMPLPWYGVAEPVRVCDGCLAKKSKVKVDAAAAQTGPTVPGKKELIRPGGGRSASGRANQSAARRDAESDLARAIALSLAEANADASGGGSRGFVPAPVYGSEPPLTDGSGRKVTAVDRTTNEEDEDADLRAAIEASLREMAAAPSAPPPLRRSASSSSSLRSTATARNAHVVPPPPRPWELPPAEEDALLTFGQTVALASRAGGDVSRFPGIDELAYHARTVAEGRVRGGEADVANRQRVLREMQAKLTEAVGLYDHLATARASAVEHERATAEAQHRSWQQPAAPYGYPSQQQQPYPPTSSAHPYAYQPPPSPAWGSDPYSHPSQQPYEPYSPAQLAYGRPPAVSQTPSWSGYPASQPYDPQGQQRAPSAAAAPQGADIYPQLPESQPSQLSQPPPQDYHHAQPQPHQQPSYPVEPYPPTENAWAAGSGQQQPTLRSPPTSPVREYMSNQLQQQQQPDQQASSQQPSSYCPPGSLQQQQPSSPTTANSPIAAFPTAPVSQPLSNTFPAVPVDAIAETGDRVTAEWATVGEPHHQKQQKRDEPEEALLISF